MEGRLTKTMVMPRRHWKGWGEMAIDFNDVGDDRTIENFDQIVWLWIELFNGLNRDTTIGIRTPGVREYLEPESFKTGACLRNVFMNLLQKCEEDKRRNFQERCLSENSIVSK